MLRKLKLGSRLGLGFGVLVTLILGMVLFCMNEIRQLNHIIDDVVHDKMLKVRQTNDVIDHVNGAAIALRNLVITTDQIEINKFEDDIKTHQKSVDGLLDSLGESIKSEEGKTRLAKVLETRAEYRKVVSSIRELSKLNTNESNAQAAQLLLKALPEKQGTYLNTVKSLISFQTEFAVKQGEEATANAQFFINVLIVVSIIVIVVSILLAWVLSRSITKPIQNAIEIADQVANGRVDLNMDLNHKDEAGLLMHSLQKMVFNIQNLIAEMKEMSKQHNLGDIDVVVNVDKFSGAFREMAMGVNEMVNGHISVKKKAMACVAEFGKGNFEAPLEQFPGKKAFINHIVEQVRGNIKSLIAEIIHMSQEHDKGDIDVVINSQKFQGAFFEIAQGVNEMVNGHISVKKKAMACVAEFGKGNFEAPLEQFPGKKAFINQTIEQVRSNLKALISDTDILASAAVGGDLSTRADASKHQGDFAKIINGINNTLDAIIKPISVLQEHLERVSQGDLTAFIEQNYNGDHALLKNALNRSLDALNEILSQVSASSSQVQIGARELASSSQTVSQGSTESAASIEEISSSMAELSAQTKQNAENASVANQLASGARSTAEVGNKQMENMVSAMAEIEGASRDISKIIKVIDEIAFQTNLLALNAAVEAARAGVHGKGFAVVAEEVRNLAARSAKAAKETTEMIESTIAKVANGSSIATETQHSLKEIVSAATRVSDLVSEINVASNEQAVGLQQVNQGISQLDAVTQQNSAAAEEAAASSEELNGQAEILIDAISRFRLKKALQIQALERKVVSQARQMLPASSHSQSLPVINTLNTHDIIDLDDPEFGKF